MVYRVELDFWIDSEEENCEEIKEVVSELLEGTCYGVEEINVVRAE